MTFENLTGLPAAGAAAGDLSRTVAIAGADDEAALGVVREASGSGVTFLLVGDPDGIRRTAGQVGADLSGSTIIPPGDNGDEADTCLTAAGMCAEGRAGVLMKGHVGTAPFTRGILNREIGLTAGGALLSHVGLFADPRGGRKPFLVTDAAINIAPDVEARKVILANAVSVIRALGVAEPRIALLAPVEKVSPKIASTVEAVEIRDWVAGGGLGTAIADGPFALDVAASAEAAETKGLESPVAGQTDIYLVPDLDAGNALYKSLTVFARARAAGILAGARVPVVLTSRADSMEVKLASLGFALNVAAGAG